MKKYLLLILVAFHWSGSNAQCSQSASGFDILYRGFENKVQLKGCDKNAELVSDDCTITSDKESYIVKLRESLKEVVLHVVAASGDTLNSKTYKCLNLPAPTMFLGAASSGSYADRSSKLIQVKYAQDVPLKSEFRITAWELEMNDAKLKGTGFELDENARIMLRMGKKGDIITIIATVLGTDGIARKIGGTWTLN